VSSIPSKLTAYLVINFVSYSAESSHQAPWRSSVQSSSYCDNKKSREIFKIKFELLSGFIELEFFKIEKGSTIILDKLANS
jgi:hypothetical protein